MKRKKPKKRRPNTSKETLVRAREQMDMFDKKLTPENRLGTGDIKVIDDLGASMTANICTTVVMRAKSGKKPKKIDGKRVREKPVTILWHMYPEQMISHPYGATLPKGKVGEELREVQEEYVKELKGSLKNRTKFTVVAEELLPGELVADVAIEHLQKTMPGAKITVTMIPGTLAMQKAGRLEEPPKRAFDKAHDMFKNYKKWGKIHNVKTRGASDDARTTGASRVYVTPYRTYRRFTSIRRR